MDEYELLKEIIHDNQEGFVIHFSNGDRCKIKGSEYIRLHRIMTNASTTSVWDVLRNNDSMEEYLKEVPDEFYTKIKVFKESLEDSYWEVANKAESLFKSIYREGMEPKEFASEVRYLDNAYQGLLWNQYHIKFDRYSETIWNYIKPEFRKL
jgi:RNA ligase